MLVLRDVGLAMMIVVMRHKDDGGIGSSLAGNRAVASSLENERMTTCK